MKGILTISIILTALLVRGQTDTIFFEFDSNNGTKFIDGDTQGVLKTVYDCNLLINLPKVNYDTLRSKNGNEPFTGVLITNYRWISEYQPSIFMQSIDKFKKGEHYYHKKEHFRSPKVTKSKGLLDSISVEFEYYNRGCKIMENGDRNVSYYLPTISIDTLRSFDGSKPFTGILTTKYKWISSNHPNIFRITIDSIVDGKSIKREFKELRGNNRILKKGVSNDTISTLESYYGLNYSLSEKIISTKIDSINTLTEFFYYASDESGELFEHYYTLNEEIDGLRKIRLDDSLTIMLEYDNGAIIDVLNKNTIFVNEKNKIVTKESFFNLIDSNQEKNVGYYVVSSDFKKRSYRFIICYIQPGTYYSNDDEKKLIKWGVKNILKDR